MKIMNHLEMKEDGIQEVKEHAANLFSMLQEPEDYHSPETIELVEIELAELEQEYPKLFN
mgnify:FL=1|tara:strand:+ start:248 stop:427 length:180 start_codon:yes stop_codon:yes gene_type:complete